MAEHCSLFQVTSFSAIVPILESLANLLHCCVDNLEPFRAAGDQWVKPFALLHALADLCLLFIHPRAPNLIGLRSAGTMPA